LAAAEAGRSEHADGPNKENTATRDHCSPCRRGKARHRTAYRAIEHRQRRAAYSRKLMSSKPSQWSRWSRTPAMLFLRRYVTSRGSTSAPAGNARRRRDGLRRDPGPGRPPLLPSELPRRITRRSRFLRIGKARKYLARRFAACCAQESVVRHRLAAIPATSRDALLFQLVPLLAG
jgi:hypothetical protein